MKKIFNPQSIFWVCLLVSIILVVVGFCLPPQGVIDGSVLTAVGELLGFAALGQLPILLAKKNVEISHGNTRISATDDDND